MTNIIWLDFIALTWVYGKQVRFDAHLLIFQTSAMKKSIVFKKFRLFLGRHFTDFCVDDYIIL